MPKTTDVLDFKATNFFGSETLLGLMEASCIGAFKLFPAIVSTRLHVALYGRIRWTHQMLLCGKHLEVVKVKFIGPIFVREILSADQIPQSFAHPLSVTTSR